MRTPLILLSVILNNCLWGYIFSGSRTMAQIYCGDNEALKAININEDRSGRISI